MDLPAKPPARAAAARGRLEQAGIRRSPRRRRPSGQPPPLPRHLQTTGVGWLAAAVVLLVVSVVIFAGGLRGPAVGVTVADDAVVRWLAGLRVPGLLLAMRALAALGSWVAISALLYGLLAALLILRRLRQLLIVLAAWIMQGVIIQYIAAPLAQRPRPFGVVFRADATGSGQITWYTVFTGGCVTAQLHPAGNTAVFADRASSVLGLTTRRSLQQALAARSNGRLHLDP
jgi:hypothetical protein